MFHLEEEARYYIRLMLESLTQRRYLIPFKASRLPQQVTDVLVIGSGVAGLRAAIEASKSAEVMLLTKDVLENSNTWQAQGGIAAVLQPLDSLEMHVADTLTAGAGLCDEKSVKTVIEEGPGRVLELLDWGAKFDRQIGNAHNLAYGREGGHSFSRIVHAFGDATGRELARTLIHTARQCDSIRISPSSFVIDLITEEDRCVGALALVEGQVRVIWAKTVILASGGAGQLYRETTNPAIATGDGLAMAWRAGATLKDMEMMQFHPTTLYIAGSSRALITEAARGEGGLLVDRSGKRFMPEYHPLAELAPRDIVSRAIVEQIRRTNFSHVFLDFRHLDAAKFKSRFPQLIHLLNQFEMDPSKDLIPTHPAAHYLIAGVEADEHGRTNIPGFYAVGEAACSGLHGANRLASNSLLEGLVYGARAGAHASAAIQSIGKTFPLNLEHRIPASTKTELDITDVKSSLRWLMWRNVGIERIGERLAESREIIAFWSRYVMDKVFMPDPLGTAGAIAGWELQNMLSVGGLVTLAAYTRTESRGTHFRTDHPTRDDQHWRTHLLWRRPMETPVPQAVE